MSFRQRRDRDSWLIDTVWPDKVRTRINAPDKSTAAKLDLKIRAAMVDEKRVWKKLRSELGLDGERLQGFSELADRYFSEYVEVYNRDKRNKKSRLEALKRYFKNTSIENISIQAVDSFVSKQKKNGNTNGTINRYIATISHMIGWVAQRGFIEQNPLRGIRKLKEAEYSGERPDESVIDTIFKSLNPSVIPAFIFMRETGCRKGEVINLKAGDIDFVRASAILRKTKSGKSRQVPLTDAALAALSAMPRHGETLFYHPSTLKSWTTDSISIPWERARKKANSKLRIHDLRHAYAIRLAESGCPMHFISGVMGHHSIDFTMKYYARFSPESASRAVLRVLEAARS